MRPAQVVFDPDRADATALAMVVDRCPTGALRVVRRFGAASAGASVTPSAAGATSAAGAAAPLVWPHLHDYQQERVLVFLDPSRDPLGADLQGRPVHPLDVDPAVGVENPDLAAELSRLSCETFRLFGNRGFARVDFPAPVSPTSAVVVPAATVKETS